MSGVGDVLGRLEDHGISAQQRGEHLPGRNRHRKIEGRDEPRHADRAPEAHCPLVAKLRWHGAPEEPAAFRVRVVRGIDAFLHVPPRLGQHLAHLAGHSRRNRFFALDQQVADAMEHLAADRGRSLGPPGEPALGRLHRAGDVLGPGPREAPDDVAPLRRIAVLEIGARSGGHPLAGDEVLEVLGHTRQVSGVSGAVERRDRAKGLPPWRRRAAVLRASSGGCPRR